MELIFFSADGWEPWDLRDKPVIPDGMPILVDDDLRFEDGAVARPTVAVNQWLRELPSSGAPAPRSWAYYARGVARLGRVLGRAGGVDFRLAGALETLNTFKTQAISRLAA